MSGYTKGPWRFAGVRIGGDASVLSGERLVASVHPRHMRYPDSSDIAEQNANARLIAAAPMLLEGAMDAVEAFKLLRTVMADEPKAVEMIDAHISELEHAIAKATPSQERG